MGSYKFLEPLESVINVILTVIEPHQEDWMTRFQVIEELRNVVVSVESLKGATVEEYGSFVSNLFSKWGDLDISIQLANGLYISDAGKRRKVALLGDLLKALRQKGVCSRLQFISHARVPILKFESKFSSISCDISIDNLPGRMKSKFFLWINKIDERFRKMVLLVKEWAKSHGINDPKSGSFNSFSLTLLVIFHFQTCAPSILPPLRDIYPRNMIDDLKGVRADAEQHIAQVCLENISSFRSNSSKPANRSSLAELFISFLAKFAQLDSKAGEFGICPYTGQWEELERNKRWMPKTHALFIEDPFEQPENSARTVSTRQLYRISEVFETTRQRLLSSNQHELDLLGPFARSQLFQYAAIRSPVTNPSYGAVPFAPQMQRAIRYAPAQTHQPNQTIGMAQPHGNIHYSNRRPQWDIQAGVVQRPNIVHATSWRARPEGVNGPSKNVRRQPNATNHLPQAPQPKQAGASLEAFICPNTVHATSWRARPEGVNGPSKNVRPQPNATNHLPQAPQPKQAAASLEASICPNTVHATSWRARTEVVNGPSKSPQPNTMNHLPQVLQYQNKQSQIWKPRFVKDGTS